MTAKPTTLSALVTDLFAPTKGELVVVPQPPPTLDDLVATARQAHAEAEAAALTAVLKGIEVGERLTAIKSLLGHGSFEDFVAAQFPFSLSTAQNYRKLAGKKAAVMQMVAAKAQLGTALTIKEALTILRSMDKKRKRKAKGRAKPSEPASEATGGSYE